MKNASLSLFAGLFCLFGASNADAGLFGGSCGCEPVCCEVETCCAPARCRPGFGHRLGHRFHNHGCCAVEASCGCDVAPSCGCDAAPSCGCDAAPSCGCEPACRPAFGSRLRGLFNRRNASCCEIEVSCGCDIAPSCGCDAAPSCGCEPACRPAFGSRLRGRMGRRGSCCAVEASCGCDIEPSCGFGG